MRWLGAVLLPTMLAGLCPMCPDVHGRRICSLAYSAVTGRELPPHQVADAGTIAIDAGSP